MDNVVSNFTSDYQPQNILLTKPFPEGDVKICDLGFACLTNTGEDIRDIIGTPDYVGEQIFDTPDYVADQIIGTTIYVSTSLVQKFM